MQAPELVIALDGPAGSGKSSVARAVAGSLGLRYLDTGAMYRGVTWWLLRCGVDVSDAEAVAVRAGAPQIVMGTEPAAPSVHVDGVDVSAPIRTREVSQAVSAVSAVPEVRRWLVSLQVDIIGGGGIVVEGRDIGTVVAPGALVKVFLTASSAERARRRTHELAESAAVAESSPGPQPPPEVTVDATRSEMSRRDLLDSGRSASPLAMADDAVEIDSTGLEVDEVVAAVLRLVRERTGAAAP